MEKEHLYELVCNPHLLNAETAIELEKLTEEFPWFQLAWILYAKNLKQIKSSKFDSIVKNVAVRVPNRKLFYNYLNSKTQKVNSINEADNSFSILNELEQEQIPENGDSLIDKFLLESPGAMRLNSNTGNQLENVTRIDVLEKSTTENDEIITETLADIYLQQKKYEKALKAYAKLSLKYPEKSVYFATRIKEIEDLKNIN